MSSIELDVTNKTSSGAIHLQIRGAGDDLGVLYLSEDQYFELVKILRAGCFAKDVDFSINDPYNREDEDDNNNDIHTFFSID